MSWFQENKFIAGLTGVTVVAGAGLIFWAVSQGGKYDKAKADYDEAASAVSTMESSPLYPKEQNLKAKQKALLSYRSTVEDLQKAFQGYQPGELKNIDSATFTATLKKANEDATAALKATGAEVPDKFFLGFENYATAPVKDSATGVLSYELGAVTNLFNNLAAAKISALENFYRQPLDEETGNKFDETGKSYRVLPVELTFKGSEESLRSFISSLDDSKKFYYVVRSIRIKNEKDKAPSTADAEFKTEGAAAEQAGGAVAASGFVLPGDTPAEAAAPAQAAPTAGTVILKQVLGSEKVHAFIRIDIILFLKGQELPKA
jgi:hypothetical protein